MASSRSLTTTGLVFLALAVGVLVFSLLDGSVGELGRRAGRLGVASGFGVVGGVLVVVDRVRQRRDES